MPMYSLHSIKTLETMWIKRFPAKTFTNVGMVQRVIKNRVRAPTHHTGKQKSRYKERGGPLPVWQSTTPAGHDSSPSRDFAYIAPRSTFSGFKTLWSRCHHPYIWQHVQLRWHACVCTEAKMVHTDMQVRPLAQHVAGDTAVSTYMV